MNKFGDIRVTLLVESGIEPFNPNETIKRMFSRVYRGGFGIDNAVDDAVGKLAPLIKKSFKSDV